MIIQRTNITSILGVSFSKNYDVLEMKQAITTALPNVKKKYPNLYKSLKSNLTTLNQLIQQQQTILSQGQVVQELQTKIQQAEKVFKKVVTAYEVKNQAVITIMGSAGTGGPPIYPTARVETTPTINAVTQAHIALTQLQDELDQKNQALVALSISHKQQTEQIGELIEQQVKQSDSTSYNTDVEQYIYT